jgi:hypothetical protein
MDVMLRARMQYTLSKRNYNLEMSFRWIFIQGSLTVVLTESAI